MIRPLRDLPTAMGGGTWGGQGVQDPLRTIGSPLQGSEISQKKLF